MSLLTLLTKLAENAHHQIPMSELMQDQSSIIQKAFMTNSNVQLRNILGGDDVNYPDRDRVVTVRQ